MQATDYDRFVDVWSQAWDLYGKRVSPAAIELSFNALVRYELADIQTALTAHVNDPDTGQYPPKPADVVRLMDGRKEDRAQSAWTKLERAIRHVGQYDNVCFDDAVIHAVVRDMGGWVALCNVKEAELPFKAKDFERRYQAYLIRGSFDYPKQLTGLADQINSANGFEKPQTPVLIGDQSRAKLIYERGGSGDPVKISRVSEHLELAKQLYGPATK